ncbi:MAG: hypothetical protein J0M09_13170 [Xanthomonadales bacterium]|nr:hypothetical protein [Xanthomonadales bacterium]
MRLQQYVPGNMSGGSPLLEFTLPCGKHNERFHRLPGFVEVNRLLVRQYHEFLIAGHIPAIGTAQQRTRMDNDGRFHSGQSGLLNVLAQRGRISCIDSDRSRLGNRCIVGTRAGIGRGAHDLLEHWIVFKANNQIGASLGQRLLEQRIEIALQFSEDIAMGHVGEGKRLFQRYGRALPAVHQLPDSGRIATQQLIQNGQYRTVSNRISEQWHLQECGSSRRQSPFRRADPMVLRKELVDTFGQNRIKTPHRLVEVGGIQFIERRCRQYDGRAVCMRPIQPTVFRRQGARCFDRLRQCARQRAGNEEFIGACCIKRRKIAVRGRTRISVGESVSGAVLFFEKTKRAQTPKHDAQRAEVGVQFARQRPAIEIIVRIEAVEHSETPAGLDDRGREIPVAAMDRIQHPYTSYRSGQRRNERSPPAISRSDRAGKQRLAP